MCSGLHNIVIIIFCKINYLLSDAGGHPFSVGHNDTLTHTAD